MAELFSNAFEHGVLGLKSELKRSSDGFMQYYQERETRLAGLSEGYVIIHMQHHGDGRSGRLVLTVEDSGPGFNFAPVLEEQKESASAQYCGRGIPLVSQICETLEYQGRGNIVEAVIRWPQILDGRL